MAASGELKIGDCVRVIDHGVLAGKVGTVVSRLVSDRNRLPRLYLVAFVGFCGGHDGYGLVEQVPAVPRDGATNRFYLEIDDVELVIEQRLGGGFRGPTLDAFAAAPAPSPGDADLVRCADCNCLEHGEIVLYEEEFQQVVAVDDGEVWLRNGAGASDVADVEDIKVAL